MYDVNGEEEPHRRRKTQRTVPRGGANQRGQGRCEEPEDDVRRPGPLRAGGGGMDGPAGERGAGRLAAVTWPAPQPGLVVRYSYLWKREAEAGREEGVKARPCAVVIAVETEPGRTRVIVLPVTHAAPQPPDGGIASSSDWIVNARAADRPLGTIAPGNR